MQNNSKKVYVKTWGCQMNVYDSDRMVGVTASLGYEPTQRVEDADLVIFNTCHIREKATEKLFSELGRLHDVQLLRLAKGKQTLIAVAGCVAQAEGAEIQRRAPYVDMVFGPQTYHLLPEMIAKISHGTKRVLNTDFPTEPKFDFLPVRQTVSPVSSFLAVQEGCDKFCSYCVVPYTRGAEYTRPMAEVLAEAQQLVQKGAREITLLGQNVNAYRDGDNSLATLVHKLAALDGVKRIRYMTSHPNNMDDDLIAAHRDVPQLMPFLHLPIQSGSDSILEKMNRKHTADDYRRLIDKIRKACPNIAMSSDFIVGFPGEQDKDFEATMQVVRDIGYAQAFSFKYSARAGTPAASMPNQVSEKSKDERLAALQELLFAQQNKFNHQILEQTTPVLFETKGKRPGQIRGRTPFMQTVHVSGPEDLLGQERFVKVTEIAVNSMQGILCK